MANSKSSLGPYSVVFSGGALAAWEVGCIRELLKEYQGAYPSVMSGASAGALNAAALALGLSDMELQLIWENLKPADVFKSRPQERSWFGIGGALLGELICGRKVKESVWRTARSITSLYDSSPLDKTLRAKLSDRWDYLTTSFEGTVAFAVTSLQTNTKKYYYYGRTTGEKPPEWHRIKSFEELVGALRASAAIPILFPPYGQEVDGGVLRNQPLGAADILSLRGHPIYVLIPQPSTLPQSLNLATVPSSILQAWMNAGFAYELAHLGIRNIAAKGLGFEQRPVCVIRATVDLETLGSSLLEFGVGVTALIDRGIKDTQWVLRNFDSAKSETWADELR